MSEPRHTTDGDWVLRGGARYAASRTYAADLADELNRLDAAEALIAELTLACRRALDLVDDEENNEAIVNMPQSFGLWVTLHDAMAKAKAWEASRAD